MAVAFGGRHLFDHEHFRRRELIWRRARAYQLPIGRTAMVGSGPGTVARRGNAKDSKYGAGWQNLARPLGGTLQVGASCPIPDMDLVEPETRHAKVREQQCDDRVRAMNTATQFHDLDL